MTEAELIQECKRYNKDAQKELYMRYAPKMKGVCHRYGCLGYSASDILQDGFMKIFSNIKQFKGDGSFEGWMRRIIVNTALNYYRKKGKEPGFIDINQPGIVNISDDGVVDDQSVFDLLIEKLSREEVLDEISRLPNSLRLVLNLYIFENFSHKEISDELSISIQNSKVRLMRARIELQNSLLNLLKKKHPECAEFIIKEYKFQNAI